jgi:Family of unknown function (DUF6492)
MPGPPCGTAEYTIVTVVYEGDSGLMRIQARSLERYLDRDLIAEIVVVDNSRSGMPEGWQAALLLDYGSLGAKVRIVQANAIADIRPSISGWFSQQILKLMVSAHVRTSSYVVLDGKNHLVHRLRRHQLETEDGHPRSYLMSYEGHPMRQFLVNTLEYFALDPAVHVREFTPTTTPFTIPTQLARDLVADVEARERRPFPGAFVDDGFKRSEFFMLAAHLLSRGESLASVYDMSSPASPAIWPESSAADCLAAIATSDRLALPFFGVHRRVLPKLDHSTRLAIAEFWCRRELFDSAESAYDFLANAGRDAIVAPRAAG